LVAAVAIVFLIWCKHSSNIGRLLRGEEKTWRKGKA
jgi:glycerol-3-phosphate acyltransferase PlsY